MRKRILPALLLPLGLFLQPPAEKQSLLPTGKRITPLANRGAL
jgi:hypothetical protein